MSITPIKIATRRFSIEQPGVGVIVIEEGEHVLSSHEAVQMRPDCFRAFAVSEELAIRSARVAEINDTTRVTKYEPQSAAGRRERDELRFWEGVTRDLERTAPDRETSAERAEQSVFDEGLRPIEESDARALADFNDQAARDYGFDRGWSRRVAD